MLVASPPLQRVALTSMGTLSRGGGSRSGGREPSKPGKSAVTSLSPPEATDCVCMILAYGSWAETRDPLGLDPQGISAMIAAPDPAGALNQVRFPPQAAPPLIEQSMTADSLARKCRIRATAILC